MADAIDPKELERRRAANLCLVCGRSELIATATRSGFTKKICQWCEKAERSAKARAIALARKHGGQDH